MSHELRTPLNAIIGFSQLLELEGLEQRQHEQHVDYVLKAAGHLLELINEVLDIAQIESGRLTISPEPVALADTLRDVLTLVAPLARDRDVSLRTRTSTGWRDDGHVHADRNRLKQVLLNLLANAIKYNRTGGRVDVSFHITDTGRVRTTDRRHRHRDPPRPARTSCSNRSNDSVPRPPRSKAPASDCALKRTDRGDGRNDRGRLRPGPRNHIHDRAGRRPGTGRRPRDGPHGSRHDRRSTASRARDSGSSTSRTTCPTSPSSNESWIDSPASS